jgi:hypothetical protein
MNREDAKKIIENLGMKIAEKAHLERQLADHTLKLAMLTAEIDKLQSSHAATAFATLSLPETNKEQRPFTTLFAVGDRVVLYGDSSVVGTISSIGEHRLFVNLDRGGTNVYTFAEAHEYLRLENLRLEK